MKLKILQKITNNTQNFTDEEKNYINILLNNDILKQNDGLIKINKKYIIGTLQLKNNNAYLLPLKETAKIVTLDKEQLLGGCDGDIIIAKMIFNPKGKLKAKLISIEQKNDFATLCYIKDNEIFELKNSIKINSNVKINHLKNEDVFLLKQDDIVEVLGNISDPKVDEKISLYLYKENYRLTNFKHNIKEITNYKTRVDLTNLEFCTIDPASAKDHDDAIYYDSKDSILYVAIADVSAYIKEGNKLDNEAKKRAFSIYLPNKVLPMIPFELSADLCSLKPDVKRLSYVLKMQIDTKTLKVTNSELLEAVIISKHKYSYDEIDIKIQNNKLDIDLKQLYELTKKLKKQRLKDGYDFRTNEYRLILNEQEELIDVSEESSNPSHSLVEECMLLANKQAALKLNNIGIFRVHEEPDRKKLEQLLQSIELLGIKAKLKDNIHNTILSIQQKAANVGLSEQVDKLIIQSQQQARYSSQNSIHFGLGFLHYSHFTSPIRRYSDLVLHRILKTKNIPKDIDEVCEYISNKERDIAKLVWDLEDRKYARWAKLHLDEEFEATIVEVENEPKVELTFGMQGCRCFIENYTGEQLFSEITVKIVSSEIITKKIIVKVV